MNFDIDEWAERPPLQLDLEWQAPLQNPLPETSSNTYIGI